MTKKALSFGKVDYNGSGRKNCRVSIEIKLVDGNLSICGSIWNPAETDLYSGGQNLEEIARLLPDNAKVQRIVEVWRRWHLNDMRAGSPAQEEWLRANPVKAAYPVSSYDVACAALAGAGLNPDPNYTRDGKPYAYGSTWLKEELPVDIVTEVENWLKEDSKS